MGKYPMILVFICVLYFHQGKYNRKPGPLCLQASHVQDYGYSEFQMKPCSGDKLQVSPDLYNLVSVRNVKTQLLSDKGDYTYFSVFRLVRCSTGYSYFDHRKDYLENVKITLYPQPKGSKVDRSYYTHPENNTHNYRRLINQPDLCSQHEHVFLIFAITTIYSHFGRREILREQFNQGQFIKYKEPMIVKHIFLFAKTNDTLIEEQIKEESRQYNDIIQEDFVDSYTNVSLKAIMAWKWILEFCPNTEYIMMENDEVYVDIDKMVTFLIKDLSLDRTDDHYAVCCTMGNGRSDHLNQKKFTSLPADIVYRGNFTPLYCHGVAYAAHINIINKLYKASFSNRPFMPTDVWIGVLSEMLRFKIPRLNYLYVHYNVKRFFADPNYPLKDAMIAITDWYGHKGKEVQLMKHIIASMRKYWRKREHVLNRRISFSNPSDTYELNRTYVLVCVIPTITLLICFCLFIKNKRSFF